MKETTSIQDLQERQIWCTYILQQLQGKVKKVPLKDGRMVSVMDDDTYSTFSEAKELEEQRLAEEMERRRLEEEGEFCSLGSEARFSAVHLKLTPPEEALFSGLQSGMLRFR